MRPKWHSILNVVPYESWSKVVHYVWNKMPLEIQPLVWFQPKGLVPLRSWSGCLSWPKPKPSITSILILSLSGHLDLSFCLCFADWQPALCNMRLLSPDHCHIKPVCHGLTTTENYEEMPYSVLNMTGDVSHCYISMLLEILYDNFESNWGSWFTTFIGCSAILLP